jgi:predicted nucleic acid-binding protein
MKQTNANHFIDTNVLIYAFSAGDPRSPRAESLIATGGLISVQILNEFTNVARKKLRWGWTDIEDAVSQILSLTGPARPITQGLHAQALALAKNHAVSFYDALVVAAAAEAHCHTLFTEDLQHNLIMGGVRIRNPFIT